MKWITRKNASVDRIACPWLVKRFIDPEAEFMYVPAPDVTSVAEREGAIPYDVGGVELGHVDGSGGPQSDRPRVRHGPRGERPLEDRPRDTALRRAIRLVSARGGESQTAGVTAIPFGSVRAASRRLTSKLCNPRTPASTGAAPRPSSRLMPR